MPKKKTELIHHAIEYCAQFCKIGFAKDDGRRKGKGRAMREREREGEREMESEAILFVSQIQYCYHQNCKEFFFIVQCDGKN